MACRWCKKTGSSSLSQSRCHFRHIGVGTTLWAAGNVLCHRSTRCRGFQSSWHAGTVRNPRFLRAAIGLWATISKSNVINIPS